MTRRETVRGMIFGLALYPICAGLIVALIVGLVYKPFADWAFDAFLRFEEWAA